MLAPTPRAQRIKLATLVPDGSLWDLALEEMGAEWSRGTEGRLRLTLSPGGVVGDEGDMVRKLRLGQLQAGLFTASGLGQIEDAFHVFEVPLLFRDESEVTFVLERLRSDFEARLAKKGYVMIHWAHAGWIHLFSSKPIRSYDDFVHLKQFVWGSDARVGSWYEELGIRTVPLSAPDVLTGLQTGLVEVVPSTPLAALSLQWFRSAPYMFERRVAPLIGGTIVSQRTWKKISAEDRATLLAAARRTEERLFREVPRQEADALREMQERGLQVTAPREQDHDRWEALARHFRERMRGTSVPEDVFDRVRDLLEDYRSAAETSGGTGD